MYLDSDGDGAHTNADQLNPIGVETSVDVWLDTSVNGGGVPVSCASDPSHTLRFNSYVFCLSVQGGTVTFGTYSNELPTFAVLFGEVKSSTEYKNGFGSTEYLDAGRNRLGTLKITATSGSPSVAIVDQITNSSDVTSFGTPCAGHDFDNTYKFDACGTGDWSHVDGLGAAPVVACQGFISGQIVGNCAPGGGPLSGVTVEAHAAVSGALAASATTNTAGNYTLGPLYVGTYVVVVVTPPGYDATPNQAADVVGGETVVADFSMQCLPVEGFVSGQVVADCTPAGGPLLGVTVDAYAVGSGELAATTATNETGDYTLGPLTAGSYVIVVVTPLGYSATPPSQTVNVVGGGTVSADFWMQCVPITGQARKADFWKHDVECALSKCNSASSPPHLDGSQLCALLDLIVLHFNNNAVNSVALYELPQGAPCEDKLDAAGNLLGFNGSANVYDRAKQELMTLLLNVAAGYIGLNQNICKDALGNSATVSQGITYCDHVLDSGSSGACPGCGDALDIATGANTGQKIGAAICPTAEPQIAYRGGAGPLSFRVTPNPSPGFQTFQFTLRRAGPVRLDVYDVSGRLVVELLRGEAVAGPHSVTWSGVTGSGGRVGSGLYFARLETSDGTRTLKTLLLKP
jgi:hypothetical protein